MVLTSEVINTIRFVGRKSSGNNLSLEPLDTVP